MVGFIKRIGHDFKGTHALKVLFNSFVRSTLEYASPVWSPIYKVHVNRIERVQKHFTRYLGYKDRSCPYRADYSQRLSHFDWHSLEQRRVLADVTTLFKILNGHISSPDLLAELNLSVPRQCPVRTVRKPEMFAVKSSRTNLGRSAPLNRIMNITNRVISVNPEIDIFCDSLHNLKHKLLEIHL